MEKKKPPLQTHWCKHRPIRLIKGSWKVMTWQGTLLCDLNKQKNTFLMLFCLLSGEHFSLRSWQFMQLFFCKFNKAISLHWVMTRVNANDCVIGLRLTCTCCRQRTAVLLGPDEVLANVNWPSIQHNQMEMKVQMHRFIIYARVILIKQTKAVLAGELWHCGIHDHIKHQHPPKEMKHPTSLK